MIGVNEILEKDTGIYSGIDEDGQYVTVFRQKGYGFTMMTETHNGWFECIDYDEEGNHECVRYER